jgi:hypothetical protein
MPESSAKSRVRFQERAELLDYLLEVSTATTETLDLDQLLENVAGYVTRVIPPSCSLFFFTANARRDCASAIPSGTAVKW